MNFNEIKLFLLDMDGTIYLDEEIFDGTIDFLNKLIETKKEYIFVTNNSSKSKESYLNKLKRLNIKASYENILTSGMATALYLNKYHFGKSVYLVGTTSLEDEFKNYNIKITENSPDIVVVGYDNELNYQKLIKACHFIDEGSLFIGTNIDYRYPLANNKYLPDCGSICQMITNATGVEPLFIGKPNPFMIDYIKEIKNYKNNEICMVGDRVYTDIACGVNASVKTICVLTGEATLESIKDEIIKPELVVNSIKDLINNL